MEFLLTALAVGFLVNRLDRNRCRQPPHAPLAGTTDVVDRDAERLGTELLAARSHR